MRLNMLDSIDRWCSAAPRECQLFVFLQDETRKVFRSRCCFQRCSPNGVHQCAQKRHFHMRLQNHRWSNSVFEKQVAWRWDVCWHGVNWELPGWCPTWRERENTQFIFLFVPVVVITGVMGATFQVNFYQTLYFIHLKTQSLGGIDKHPGPGVVKRCMAAWLPRPRLPEQTWHGNVLLSCGAHKLGPTQQLNEFNAELVPWPCWSRRSIVNDGGCNC